MEMILPKPGNGAERNLDAFACVQLAAKLDVIGAAIAGVALADVLARSSTTVQSVQTGVGSDNRPKPSLPLLNPAHVISDQLVPLRPHRAEPRVTKRPKSFPRMQQPRSVLKAKLVA